MNTPQETVHGGSTRKQVGWELCGKYLKSFLVLMTLLREYDD